MHKSFGFIKGVSFHRQSFRMKDFVKAKQSLDIGKLSELIKQETPKEITPFDIKKLLHDMGRNELHTHISESVEFSLKWFKISRLITNYTKRRNYLSLLKKRKLSSLKKREITFSC